MEKAPLREEEIKELEEEIDLAVDRLFVEKKKGTGETLRQEHPRFVPPAPEPPDLEPSPADLSSFEPASFEPEPLVSSLQPLRGDALSSLEPLEEPEKGPDFGEIIPSPPPSSYLKTIDQLEAQLLALEWEITDEKLQNREQAVKSLSLLVKQRSDVVSILGFMEDMLKRMMANEEQIRPPMITFLLDAKETVKLLLRKETDGEVTIYKQLALAGMEARFATFQERERVPSQPSPVALAAPEAKGPDVSTVHWKKIEETMEGLVSQWKPFLGEAGETLRRIERCLCAIEGGRPEPVASPAGERPLMDITIFETSGRCYGLESQKILKLLKVPPSFEERYGHYPKVRLKDHDVSLIDLQKAFPGESWGHGGALRLVMIREEEGYKGLMVEKVLKRLKGSLEERKGDGRPVLGIFRWNYQSHPVDVPILDLARM
jgi:hypothetical protein